LSETNKDIQTINDPITSLSHRRMKRAERIHIILKYIKENQGTNAHIISKKLKFSYADVCGIIRDLEYVNAVVVKQEVLDSVVRRRLYVPEEESK